jgi:hypothetical protein
MRTVRVVFPASSDRADHSAVASGRRSGERSRNGGRSEPRSSSCGRNPSRPSAPGRLRLTPLPLGSTDPSKVAFLPEFACRHSIRVSLIILNESRTEMGRTEMDTMGRNGHEGVYHIEIGNHSQKSPLASPPFDERPPGPGSRSAVVMFHRSVGEVQC